MDENKANVNTSYHKLDFLNRAVKTLKLRFEQNVSPSNHNSCFLNMRKRSKYLGLQEMWVKLFEIHVFIAWKQSKGFFPRDRPKSNQILCFRSMRKRSAKIQIFRNVRKSDHTIASLGMSVKWYIN